LPNDQVLSLVLGMALFRNEPVHEVARRLNICAQGLASDQVLARSGVTEARKRLGADPVESLFRQTSSIGATSATTEMTGTVYRSSRWMVLCREPLGHLSSESILAPAIPALAVNPVPDAATRCADQYPLACHPRCAAQPLSRQ
jgi:hypothetical protein